MENSFLDLPNKTTAYTKSKSNKRDATFSFFEGTFLRINVECEKPKYAKGKYDFETLENVLSFLLE